MEKQIDLALLTKAVSILLIVILMGCTYQYNYDPIDPRMPEYSQYGANRAAALYNQEEVWTLVNRCTPNLPALCEDSFWISPDGPGLNIFLSGKTASNSHLGVKISLPIAVTTFEELTQLEGQTFSIGTEADVEFLSENNNLIGTAAEGKFQIKKVEIRPSGTIVFAGTFGLKGLIDRNQVELTYGRFDFNLVDRFHFLSGQ